ncbi:MAG: hypothetical protein IKV39_04540 [Clostridia bacterium]|nr:hypothetical protein [Clostridia bacterium]
MSSSTPDISGIISKLMQNDEFSAMVKELRGKDNIGTDSADIMDKLPEIMSMLSPMMGDANNDGQKESGNISGNSEVVQPKKSLRGDGRFDKGRATKLMSAIKPYLSAERCTMIDKCMSVMQIGDIMSVLSGLDMSGKSGG